MSLNVKSSIRLFATLLGLLCVFTQYIDTNAAKFDPLRNYAGNTRPLESTLKILAVGGSNHDHVNIGNDVEYFNPYVEENQCKKKPHYPRNTRGLCGSEYMFCGADTNKCYELVEDKWIERSDLVRGRVSATCTYLKNSSFWLLGGWGGDNDNMETLKSSEILVNETSEFQMSVKLPVEMTEHCMARINDTHFFVAGNDYDNVAYIINTAQDEFVFTSLPSMKKHRNYAACGTINEGSEGEDIVLLVAGGGYFDDITTTSEIFSLSNYEWKEGPTLPIGFNWGGYYSDEFHPLIMVGGSDQNNTDSSAVMEYQRDLNTFEILPGKLSTPRYHFAVSGVYNQEDC